MVPSYFSGRSGRNLVGQLTYLNFVEKARQQALYGPVSSSEVVPLPAGKPDDACSSVAWRRFFCALSRAVWASSLALTSLR